MVLPTLSLPPGTLPPLGRPLALLTREQAGSVQAPHLNTFECCLKFLVKDLFMRQIICYSNIHKMQRICS